MKLKLSCADFTFPLLPTEAALDLIAAMEFDGVDLGVFAEGCQVKPQHILDNVPRRAREFSRRLRERGLQLADLLLTPGAGFEPLAPNHPDPRERQRSRDIFLRVLEFVTRLDGRHFTVLRLTPGLTLCLDCGHFISQGIAQRLLDPLIQCASHFHARGATRSRMQVPMKANTIDFARVLRAMRRTRYRGYICCEYCWEESWRCNEVDTISETILLRDLLKTLSP